MLELLDNPGNDPALTFIERALGPRQPEFGIPADELAGIEMRRYGCMVGSTTIGQFD